MWYTSRGVCEAVGITYRVLDYWHRLDVFQPSVAEAAGAGSRRLYSDDDLRLVRVLNALRLTGARTDTLTRAARQLRADPNRGASRVLVSPLGELAASEAEAEAAGWPWWVAVVEPAFESESTAAA